VSLKSTVIDIKFVRHPPAIPTSIPSTITPKPDTQCSDPTTPPPSHAQMFGPRIQPENIKKGESPLILPTICVIRAVVVGGGARCAVRVVGGVGVVVGARRALLTNLLSHLLLPRRLGRLWIRLWVQGWSGFRSLPDESVLSQLLQRERDRDYIQASQVHVLAGPYPHCRRNTPNGGDSQCLDS
jgi:hypothetical protein